VSRKRSKKSKAPQLFTTVLLVACPIAMAQQAQAQQISTSFAGGLFGEQRILGLHQTGLANQRPFLLGMNPNQSSVRFPFTSPLSFIKASTPEQYQQEVAEATITLNRAKAALETAITAQSSAQKALKTAQEALDSAETALEQANSAVSEQNSKVEQAETAKNSAQDAYDQALEAFVTADDNLTTKATATATALAALNAAQRIVTNDASSLTTSNTSLASAQSSLSTAQSNQQQAQALYNSAVTAYNQAKAIANQPAPTYRTDVILNLLFNSDFSRGNEGWSGLSIGWQNSQPGYFNGNIAFSYMNQTVTQGLYSGPFNNATLTLSAEWFNDDSNRNITDSYAMTVSARDINQNPVGSATFTSNNTRHDWETKSVTLVATGPVSYITVSFSGIDNGYWLGNYGPRVKNLQLQVSSQTPIQAPPSSNQTATMSVDITEGQEATFTAPNGGIFTSSNLRYEAIDDPTCGADISPTNLGGNTIQLAADNSIWGDPCGGWYKRIVGTLTYTVQAEPDASYALAVSQALTALNTANTQLATAQQNVSTAESQVDSAESALSTSQQAVAVAQSAYEIAQQEEASATAEKNTASDAKDSAQESLNTVIATYDLEVSAQTTLTSEQSEAESAKSVAEGAYATAESSLDDANESVAEAEAEVTSSQEALDNIPLPEEPEPEPEIEPEPEPTPEPEEPKAPEIPEGDPRELTEEQVTELVAQAEAVLESAEQGSSEYEQALEALAVAADADDPEISAELAAIPLLGDAAAAALEVLNDLGNVGADMAPQVREEAEKTIIASVIATGAAVNAVQAAAGAAASAAAATATSTSGSSSGGGGGGASGSSSSSSTRRPKA
jgi:hypothetical protein